MDGYVNVDKVVLPTVDHICDLSEPWPFDDDSSEEIQAHHVFEHLDHDHAFSESTRVLESAGELIITLPIGINAMADPTHRWEWIWDSPEYITGARHWDADMQLDLIGREVTIHSHLPGILKIPFHAMLRTPRFIYSDGRWLFDIPFTSGEFRVRFRKR